MESNTTVTSSSLVCYREPAPTSQTHRPNILALVSRASTQFRFPFLAAATLHMAQRQSGLCLPLGTGLVHILPPILWKPGLFVKTPCLIGLEGRDWGWERGWGEASSVPSLVSTHTGPGWKSTEMSRLATGSGRCVNPINFIFGGQSWMGLTAVSRQMSLLICTVASNRDRANKRASEWRSDRDQGSSACLREAGAWQPSVGNHSIRFNNISENKQTKKRGRTA